MFRNCKKLQTLDVSKFNTSKANAFNELFYGCNSLTELDVSNFDTSNATGMRNMFFECKSLTTIDVSHFNTSKVVNVSVVNEQYKLYYKPFYIEL